MKILHTCSIEVLTEVNRTVSDRAADIVGDSHGQVVPVDETDIVPIKSISSTECPFSHRRRGHTRSRMGITQQSTVAACGNRVGSVGSLYPIENSGLFSPPVRQELGPGFCEKLQLRRPQIRPAVQLSGTVKVFSLCGGAVRRGRVVKRCGCADLLGKAKKPLPSQPVATFGTAVPTFRSVKTAGLKIGDESSDDP